MKLKGKIALVTALASAALFTTPTFISAGSDATEAANAAESKESSAPSEDAAESSPTKPLAEFEAPVRLKSGDRFIGRELGLERAPPNRMYPSPTLYDINHDGHKDLVIGCIFGYVTSALRSKDSLAWKSETVVNNDEGKTLKLHNW